MLKRTRCTLCGNKLKRGKLYCSIQCRNKDKAMPGNKNPNWKGGRLKKNKRIYYCVTDGSSLL